jgi:DNA-directed RNA polymerase specialized sigma24 family protein
MTEDPELLHRYLENQEAAFSELVRRHLALVYGTALRRTNGDSHRAEDIAQLVFARLAREAMKVARHPAIHGWLYVATRHAAAEVMRTEQRRKNREAKIHAMHHGENVPAALRGQGFGPDNLPQDLSGYPELTKENPEWQKLGSALKASLGADGFTFYQQYERSVPRRNVLDQATSTLFYTEEPLTRKMAGELMDGVLLKNQIQFQAPGAPTNTISISADAYGGYRARVGDMFRGGSPLDLEAPVTDAAIAQAQTFPSPIQLGVLKDVQAQQLA